MRSITAAAERALKIGATEDEIYSAVITALLEATGE